MSRTYRHILTAASLAAAVLLAAACQDDITARRGEPGLPAEPMTVAFSYQSPGEIEVTTRSTSTTRTEARVINAYALIFDSEGDLVYRDYFDHTNRVTSEGALTDNAKCWYVENLDPDEPGHIGQRTNGKLRISPPDVADGTLCLVANLNDQVFNITRSRLDLVNTLEDFDNLRTIFTQPSEHRMGVFMTTGRTSVTINKDAHTFTLGDTPIQLTHADAKIHVKVGVDNTRAVTEEGVEMEDGSHHYTVNVTRRVRDFKPTTWQVMSMPDRAWLKPGKATPVDAALFNSEEHAFETVDENVAYTGFNGTTTTRTEHGFSFYMLEHLPTAKKTVGGNLNMREKRENTAEGKQWEYAPDNGTYLVIKGDIEMEWQFEGASTDGGDPLDLTQSVVSTVTYYVHLGDWTTDPDNYCIERGTRYYYTINIRGVENILTEVRKEGEPQPGAMGDVDLTWGERHIFDAHYAQRVFHFNYTKIALETNNIDDLTWYVSTPFGRKGTPERYAGHDMTTGLDYGWVHFMVHSKEATYVEPHGGPNAGPLTVTNEEGAGRYSNKNRIWPGAGSDKLMNVSQLCAYLREQAKKKRDGQENDFDLNGNITVTAFVDEFCYQIDPITNEMPDNLWHQFTGQPHRVMHITCILEESMDEESSYTASIVTIRQRAIQTIFDTEDPTVAAGWGVESADELPTNSYYFSETETRLEASGDRNDISAKQYFSAEEMETLTQTNGLFNSARIWGLIDAAGNWQTRYWTDYMDYVHLNNRDGEPTLFLKEGMRTLRYAGLQRNRDENGDGIIDPEEIKWYMAATSQLKDLFIGEAGLRKEAQLSYVVNQSNVLTGAEGKQYYPWRKHIVSSYVSNGLADDGKLRPEIMWAEEGTSTGAYGEDDIWGKPGLYALCMVRNLSNNSDDLHLITHKNAETIRAVTVTENADGTYSFDLSRMSNKCLRIKVSGDLQTHNEKHYSARPHVRFSTGPDGNDGQSISNGDYPVKVYDYLADGLTLTPTGYRLPNVRELSVINSYAPNGFWKKETIIGSTVYSYGDPRVGGNGYDTKATGGPYTWYVKKNKATIDEGKGYIVSVRDDD